MQKPRGVSLYRLGYQNGMECGFRDFRIEVVYLLYGTIIELGYRLFGSNHESRFQQ